MYAFGITAYGPGWVTPEWFALDIRPSLRPIMVQMSVSVIIPAYNEAARLPMTLRATADYFQTRAEPFEILVVDDGSTDKTPQCVTDFAGDYPALTLQCLELWRQSGQGLRGTLRDAAGKRRPALVLRCRFSHAR